MPDTLLKLPPPAYVIIESSDGEHCHRADAYDVKRMLDSAEKQPNEEKRWEMVRKWIAEKLNIPFEDVTTNQAMWVHNGVIGLTNKLNEELAKESFTIASSAASIQESPATS